MPLLASLHTDCVELSVSLLSPSCSTVDVLPSHTVFLEVREKTLIPPPSRRAWMFTGQAAWPSAALSCFHVCLRVSLCEAGNSWPIASFSPSLLCFSCSGCCCLVVMEKSTQTSAGKKKAPIAFPWENIGVSSHILFFPQPICHFKS